ncbi:extracellular solute-binding protein [Thiohalophilus sp.]|uniref:extracellular solute-binding protein n=1 Tax=Thiohalophilus sp. TaxID=3028392 RepID=UPI002ACD87AA|nr:extracellular solute-binding protein [Thiohalophilus sp.]MDZ7661423.1 ABC transporter substrate-binding protein [Thiohalophilus sp.]
MQRRTFLQSLAALVASGALPPAISRALAADRGAVSVDALPALEGDLTLYLGRGEGGLYEDVLGAIKQRNPQLNLRIRRGPTAALANTLVAEARAGVKRADLFWAVDSGALGLVDDAGLARPLPEDIRNQLKPGFRYPSWSPVTGRIRTLPYNTERIAPEQIPDDIMTLADSDLNVGWAPAYASFQSFITAMRLLEGEQATRDWLQKIKKKSRSYAGELGVVLAVERGEVDVGFANHYYTLRLKTGKPDARVDLAFTRDDAGCLLNASGVMALSEGETPMNFIRYLLSQEVQSYLVEEAYEIPMVQGVAMPQGLPPLQDINPPEIDLTRLADLRPTLDLMRDVGVL